MFRLNSLVRKSYNGPGIRGGVLSSIVGHFGSRLRNLPFIAIANGRSVHKAGTGRTCRACVPRQVSRRLKGSVARAGFFFAVNSSTCVMLSFGSPSSALVSRVLGRYRKTQRAFMLARNPILPCSKKDYQ